MLCDILFAFTLRHSEKKHCPPNPITCGTLNSMRASLKIDVFKQRRTPKVDKKLSSLISHSQKLQELSNTIFVSKSLLRIFTIAQSCIENLLVSPSAAISVKIEVFLPGVCEDILLFKEIDPTISSALPFKPTCFAPSF